MENVKKIVKKNPAIVAVAYFSLVTVMSYIFYY